MKLLRIPRIVSLLAALVVPTCNSAMPETIVPGIVSTATTGAEVTIASGTSTIESGTWKKYENSQAGYSVEYPADWTVSEQVAADGSILTNFSPIDGSSGVLVIVQSGDLGGGASELPNTRCEEVQVGELTGMRCFDTINQVASTTIMANGKTYTIVPLGKHLDENLYSRFLSGFQIIQ